MSWWGLRTGCEAAGTLCSASINTRGFAICPGCGRRVKVTARGYYWSHHKPERALKPRVLPKGKWFRFWIKHTQGISQLVYRWLAHGEDIKEVFDAWRSQFGTGYHKVGTGYKAFDRPPLQVLQEMFKEAKEQAADAQTWVAIIKKVIEES